MINGRDESHDPSKTYIESYPYNQLLKNQTKWNRIENIMVVAKVQNSQNLRISENVIKFTWKKIYCVSNIHVVGISKMKQF